MATVWTSYRACDGLLRGIEQQTKNHFAGVGKMVGLGTDSQRPVEDDRLSRFDCCFIAQKSDPRRLGIAQAQQYFAV